MFSSREPKWATIGQSLLLLLMLECGAGCAESDDAAAANKRKDLDGIMKIIYGDLPSANFFLFPHDFKAFRAGRTKDDVLEDVKWRGDFGPACEYKGKSVSFITYELVLQPRRDTMNFDGEFIFATFVDDKFER